MILLYKRLVSLRLDESLDSGFTSFSILCVVAIMPPRAINSPKKKRSKRKGSDASTGRAGVPKKSRQATDLTETLSIPLVSLGLAEAEDGAPRRSGRPNAGTGGRNSQLEKIGAVLESQSRSRPPKGSTSLSPNIPVNPQAPEPARKGRKGRSKVRHVSIRFY
jgi:hypothetical protein